MMRAWLSPMGVASLFLAGMYAGMALGSLNYGQPRDAIGPALICLLWLLSVWLDGLTSASGGERWERPHWRFWFHRPVAETEEG